MASEEFGLLMDVGAASSRISALGDTVFDAQETELRAVSQTVVNDIQRRAPVATGHLRSSYDYQIESRGNRNVARIGSPVEYAEYQEFGTSAMPPQPHVRPALDAHRDEIIEALGGKAIRKGKEDA